MFEVDMAIERNSCAMRILEPIAEEAMRLRQQEEKDGQPIGRLQYTLPPRTLNSIHIGAIARVYGEAGDEVIQHLMANALVVVPIVFERLKEKDAEWRKVKVDLDKEWKTMLSDNVEGSLDVQCHFYKRELEKCFTADWLLGVRILYLSQRFIFSFLSKLVAPSLLLSIGMPESEVFWKAPV